MSASLTDDEVRERFSAYREGALPDAETLAVRARLAESPVLAAEYARFERVIAAVAGIAHGEEKSTDSAGEGGRVDLLRGVQSRLHKRSRGRFYGSWAERLAGVVPLEWIVGALLLLVVLAYAATVTVRTMEPVREGGAGAVGR